MLLLETEAETVPDCAVIINGLPEAAPVRERVSLPYPAEPEDPLFQRSNTTSFSLSELLNASFLSQNSTVTPVSKLVLKFDSRVPCP